MTKGVRKGQRRIGKKGQSVGRQVRTPARVSQTHRILQLLSLDNPQVAAELRYRCETGTGRDAVFIQLLNAAYGKHRKGKDEASKGRRMNFIKSDGRSWDPEVGGSAATSREVTLIESFVLGNAKVRSRLVYELNARIMRPAIYKWFIEHGLELLNQTETRPLLAFVSEKGLPWLNDPMKKQEADAIAGQEAADKMQERVRQEREQEKKGPVAGEQEAEEREELEVYRG